MTREEAIENLKEIIDEGWLISDFEKCIAIDACEMAIKALEQEPCEDCISRQTTLDVMYKLCGEGTLENNPWRDNPHIDAIIDTILDLPSVTPQQKVGKWIKTRDSYGNNHFICPFCGHDIATKYSAAWDDNYCSNCGKRLESEV